MEYTKEDPGCYHRMLEYLSNKTGIPVTYELNVGADNFHSDVIYELRGTKYKLKKLMIKGGTPYLWDQQTNTPLFPLTTKFDRKYVVKRRKPEDFNYPIWKCGTYRDSHTGGSYSKVPMYKVDDQYFAMMECAHS